MSLSISYEFNARGTLFEIDRERFQTGAAGTRCFHDVRSQFGEEAALNGAVAASKMMAEARSRWPDARRPQLGHGESEITVEGFLLALRLSPSEIPALAARYRTGSAASVDLRAAGAQVQEPATSSSVLFGGTADDVREYLGSIFGSSAFRMVGSEIELELPLVGKDKQPRASGETVRVKMRAPASWSVQAPEGGTWWHVVPEGASATLCTIPLASWTTAVRDDDGREVNCPWCRIRLIAIEIAASPAFSGIGGWTDRCVYTMKHSDDLEAAYASGGKARWHESRGWKTGRELVEACAAEESVPIIFSAAERDSGLIFYARLDAVEVDEAGTTYEVSGLRSLADALPLSSLTVASSGSPLPDSYIRPYAICRTPSFLVPPDDVSTDSGSLPRSQPTLHEEIAAVLRERDNAWQTTAELAERVNKRGRFHKRDGTEVSAFQIHGRTRNYGEWFEREGSRVRLRPDAPT